MGTLLRRGPLLLRRATVALTLATAALLLAAAADSPRAHSYGSQAQHIPSSITGAEIPDRYVAGFTATRSLSTFELSITGTGVLLDLMPLSSSETEFNYEATGGQVVLDFMVSSPGDPCNGQYHLEGPADQVFITPAPFYIHQDGAVWHYGAVFSVQVTCGDGSTTHYDAFRTSLFANEEQELTGSPDLIEGTYTNAGWDASWRFGSPSVFTVNSTGDDSDANRFVAQCDTGETIIRGEEEEAECTIRAAIEQANTTAGPDHIVFDIPGFGPKVIQPESPLPNITQSVEIDATTQPAGRSSASLLAQLPRIELDGSEAGDSVPGLRVLGSQTVIRGFAIHSFTFGPGVHIPQGVSGVTVEGNYIGTNLAGVAGKQNQFGVLVEGHGNTIAGNLLSGHKNSDVADLGFGVLIRGEGASFNDVRGNLIGVSPSGTELRNDIGVGVIDGSLNTIGGTIAAAPEECAGACNFIVHNGSGIQVSGEPAVGNVVEGNYLSGNGIQLAGPGGTQVRRNSVAAAQPTGIQVAGGLHVVAENVVMESGQGIRATQAEGVTIGPGNVVTRNKHGITLPSPGQFEAPSIGVTITRNSVFLNDGLGIDLAEDGVTKNDGQDVDTGPNLLQNYPHIAEAFADEEESLLSATSLRFKPGQYTIEFFSNLTCDPQEYGEGQHFLAAAEGAANAAGQIDVVDVKGPKIPEDHRWITATATDAEGNTSEFGPCARSARALAVLEGGVEANEQMIELSGGENQRMTSGEAEAFEVGDTIVIDPWPLDDVDEPLTEENRIAAIAPGDGGKVILTLASPLQHAHPAGTTVIVTPAAAITPGDVDCDADVDSVDALAVLRQTAGLAVNAECLDAADVDCDRDVDAVDALNILRHVAGLPVNSPPGCRSSRARTLRDAFRASQTISGLPPRRSSGPGASRRLE